MKKLITICVVCAFVASTATAHWVPQDGHKMHFPQLPDPQGWDIAFSTTLADDWQCSGTGPVTDIHFWGSWRQDIVGNIQNIHLSIHEDIPANDPRGTYYSQPGIELWSLDTTDFTISDSFYGCEGWYDPTNTAETTYPDHDKFYQYNITDIPQPFTQQEDTVYWLDIMVTVEQGTNGDQPEFGWKTADVNSYPDPYTGSHYRDDAVFFSYDTTGAPLGWFELYDPYELDKSLDLAFVITPEPATIGLLGLGALSLIRRKK